jgi:hypothetical protein
MRTRHFVVGYDDQNEDQQSQVSIEESIPPLEANVIYMDIELSSSKELVVPKTYLGGTKRLHETNSPYSD